MMTASQISAAIRAKKKAIMEASPGITDTSPVPDMNAQDVWNMEKDGYVEQTLKSPKKMDARETAMNEPAEDVVLSSKEMRMKRLQSYLNGMKLSD